MSKAISVGMDFQREFHAGLLEFVEDGVPLRGEIGVAVLDLRVADRREAVEQRPDFGAGEAVDDVDAEVLGGVRGADHFLRGALLARPSGLPSPQTCGGQDGLVPLVDVVANGLADEVVGDGPGLEAVLGEERVAFVAVGFVWRALKTSKWSPQQASSRPS